MIATGNSSSPSVWAMASVLLTCGAMAVCAGCGPAGSSSVPPPVLPAIASVSVSCTPGSILAGQTSQCSAAVSGTGNYSSSVVWSAASGAITNSGLYTAPAVLPASNPVTVTATSVQDASKSGTASIVVSIPINVDVSMANQTFEGWGTSLAWFANSVGGWTNTANRDNLMEALFSPSNGLGLNYLRYNIGGGNDPLCGTGGAHFVCINPAYQGTAGYEPGSGTYDWTQDANQRWVAAAAQSLGANLFEAVSYSPPYWMTVSGTSEGGVGGAPNLSAGYFGTGAGTFAEYLTTVAGHFNSDYGITFHHLEPLNESGQAWWTAGSPKQEGCAFTLSGQQQIVQDVQSLLASNGLATQVAAMDEYQEGQLNSSAGSTASEFTNYSATTQSDISAINTHAYASTVGSVALATAAQRAGKRLTVSEWGSNDNTGQDLSNQILADVYTTRPVAWTIWQPDWPGLLNINYSAQSFTLNEAYYVYEQYAKFIRPGFQFVAIGDAQSLAAFNQRTNTLVIVTQNWGASARNASYNLSNFTGMGTSAAVYQTSATEKFASLGNLSIANGAFSASLPANSVTTFVISGASFAPPVVTANDNATGTGNGEFNYNGAWSYNSAQPGAYGNDTHGSSTANDFYTFQFSGQQARVYAPMAPDGGIEAFSVDGGGETYFDTYAPTRADDLPLFSTPTLAAGVHTLKVRVTGLKNPASVGYNVTADRIDTIAGGTATGQGMYKIVNVGNGLDLEVNSASLADGGAVDTYQDVSGANNEQWNLMAVGDGSYRIVNGNSGLDLEVNGWSKSNGGVVDQWQDDGAGAANEYWNIVPMGNGTYRIVNASSGLDLEVNATTGVVDQWADLPGSANQHWTLTQER
jgi:O-glycosyl hydrolase